MKKFFVCVFCEYEIHYCCDFSYLDEFGDICSDKVDKVFTCDGSHLMETIIRLISDNLCISFSYDDDTLFIEHFNPDNGIGADFTFTIKEVIKEKLKNGS